MSGADIKILRSVAELEGLATEWAALADRFGSPLLDHDWFMCAAHALHREADLRIVTVRQSGVLTAVAPMALSDSRGHVVLLGSTVLHEPGSWLYSSEAALHKLTRALVGMGQVIVMDRVPAGCAVCHGLPRRMQWQALAINRQTTESYAVPTDAPWEAYCASLSPRTRRGLAGARARAERECGTVRVSRLEAGPHEAEKALGLFVDVEAGGWKARQGSALATRPELLGFFRRYVECAAARGRLRVTVLWIGDRAAAVELGVEAYGKMWGLKLAYDERFSAFAPALQLVHASIGASTASGLKAYEFLGAAEPWQKRWRPQRREYKLTAIYPVRPGAMVTALRDMKSVLSRRFRSAPHQEVCA